MITIKARIVKQVYECEAYKILGAVPCEDDNSDDNWSIELNQYGNFSIKDPTLMLSEGKEYTLELSESEFRGAKQYIVNSIPSLKFESIENITDEMELEILQDITTSAQAKYINEAYPNFIRLVLGGKEEEIDVKKIYNVGDVRLKIYIREVNKKYKYYHIMDENRSYELSMTDCKALCMIYSTIEAVNNMIKKSPYYCLIDVCERTFKKVDNLILDANEDFRYSDERIEYFMLDLLNGVESEGSTYISANELAEYVNGFDSEMIPLMKTVVMDSRRIYYDEKEKNMAKMSTYVAECTIADFVKNSLNNSQILNIDYTKYQDVDGFKMTDAQLKALENFCKYNVSIIAGHSGSGKSASTKGLISLMEDNNLTYTLLSSTGKASRVLSEACGRPATTIHKRCFEGEICTDVVIVDECSMISLDVFMMLLNSIKNDNVRLVLVGDHAQLPAIGLSKIFTDLIESDIVPKVVLTEIFRYRDNGSLFVATNIRNGKSFFESDEVKIKDNTYKVSNNYKFIDTENIFETVIDEYQKLLSKDIKPIDILCLSPMNVKDKGTYRLNNEIQSLINPPKPNEKNHTRKISDKIDAVTITFRIGDIVINKKNDYSIITLEGYNQMHDDWDLQLTEDEVDKSTILNGQIGTIRNVMEDGLIIQFDEELLFFNKKKIQNNLLLAYAISTHASQGSSVSYSISIVCNEHKRMLSKGLLYVADTRCRKQHIDIGNIEAFENALKIDENDLRKTMLKKLLLEKNHDLQGGEVNE